MILLGTRGCSVQQGCRSVAPIDMPPPAEQRRLALLALCAIVAAQWTWLGAIARSSVSRVIGGAVAKDATPAAVPSTRARSCGDIYPLQGRWDVHMPPYFHALPSQCDTPALPSNATLGRRRILFMGNSIARGMAFTLAALLQHGSVSWKGLVPARVAQKTLCTEEGPGTDDLGVTDPGCSIYSAGGMEVLYLGRWYFWRPRGSGDMSDKTDHCGDADPAMCLAPFLSGSSTEDVLIFNVGLEHLFRIGESASQDYDGELPLVAGDAVRLMRHLRQGGFAGRAVWLTVSPTCSAAGQYRFAQLAFTQRLNRAVTRALQDAGLAGGAHGATFVDYEGFFYLHNASGTGSLRQELFVGVEESGAIDCIHQPNEGYAAALAYALAALP